LRIDQKIKMPALCAETGALYDDTKKNGWSVISMKRLETTVRVRAVAATPRGERTKLMSFGMLRRVRVPGFSYPRSRAAVSCKRRRQHFGFGLALFMLLCCSTGQSYGATLECPEIGSASVPDLIGNASGGGLFATESRVDLVNEINESINRLQIASPTISWTNVQNVLIAAYCRAVARKSELTATEKWDRMRQFESILERQIAANMMPAGTLIIANVPLPPDVYRELKRQALVSKQTTSELMTAILTRAAGK
jgi:hypothetical protein